MEGYFPIRQFCELSGISADTAYHRALRGTSPAFKDKSGKWFIYFCDDEPDCPEGFCSIDEYARMYGVNTNCIRIRIRAGNITEKDYIRKKVPVRDIKKGCRERLFIRKSAPFLKKSQLIRNSNNSRIYKKCPDGYIPLSKWAENEGVLKYDCYNWIKNEYLKPLKLDGHYYIPEGMTVETVYLYMDARRKENEEWLQSQKLPHSEA